MIYPDGMGYFIWQAKRIGDFATAAKKAKDAGVSWVSIKVTDGPGKFNLDPDTKHDYAPEIVQAFKDQGITVFGWGYVYGFMPEQEAQAAVDRVKALGLAGWMIDAEGEMNNKFTEAALYASTLKTRLPADISVGLCSFRFPNQHMEFPWKNFLYCCDYNIPQVYWVGATNAGQQLVTSIGQFTALYTKFGLKQIPCFPLGAAYGEDGWRPAVAEIKDFIQKAKDLALPGYGFWEWNDAVKIYPEYWEAIKTTPKTEPATPVTTTQAETAEKDKDVTAKFVTNPIGLFLDKRHDIKGIDRSKVKNVSFVMGHGGSCWGTDADVQASHDACQLAADLGVPYIQYVDVVFDQILEAVAWSFPEMKDDWNKQWIDRLITDSGVPRSTVHGLMLGITEIHEHDEAGHRYVSAGWVRKYFGEHLVSELYKIYQKPQYFMLNKGFIDHFCENGLPFESGGKLNDDIIAMLSALDGQCLYVPAYDTDPAKKPFTFDAVPFPPDAYAPAAYYAKKPWYFSMFVYNKFYTQDISAGAVTVPLVVFNAPAATLYGSSNLNWSGTPPVINNGFDPATTTTTSTPTSTTPTNTTPATNTPTSTTTSGQTTVVQTGLGVLERIAVALEKIAEK